MEDLDWLGLNFDEIRENVRSQIASDDTLKEYNIWVEMTGDELILDGEVNSHEQKWRAEEIASNVLGVLHITNNIIVKR